MEDLLVIMAKEPRPGRVKTRLQPRLSPEESADLYHCFLRDRIEGVRGLSGIKKAIAYSPPSAARFFARLAPADFALFPQRGKDLSDRLTAAASFQGERPHGAISIIDSDSPDLPPSLVLDSFRLLRGGADVVFGPCHDGGYYLVGMRRPCPGLFDAIPWSTDRVLSASLARAASLKLKAEVLPPWRDTDTFDDLQALYFRLRNLPLDDGRGGQDTLAFLERLLGEGKSARERTFARGGIS